MWTPRRVMLLFLGLAASLGGYIGYSRFLGGIDGLPELPAALAVPENNPLPPNLETISATELLLQKIFGPNSPEVKDQEYNLKLELRDKGIVFACGQPQFTEKSRFVTVTPFSIALLGKRKPEHLMAPGEVQEVSTFHADRAIIEYDKEVASLQDMTGKARMVGMELLSDPELLSFDPRRGLIEVTNNQKDADPNHKIIFRTPGPLFYSAPKMDPVATTRPEDQVQVWTHAPVEVVDRKNLPQPLRRVRNETARTSGEELRKKDAIANILLGETLPPPTILAVGMRIALTQEDAGPSGTQGARRSSTGFSGVRYVELTEKVQFNNWSGGGVGGFPGSGPEPTTRKPVPNPPEALAGVGGSVLDAVAIASRFNDKTLLVIETPGPFRYDFGAGRATFDAAAVTEPTVSNHVTAARLSASGKQDYLVCKNLTIDFATPQNSPAAKVDPKVAPVPRSTPAESRKIQSIRATGPHVFVSIESEQLEAQGTELLYANEAPTRKTTTVLRGDPVIAARSNHNLQAGSPGQKAEIQIVSIAPDPTPVPAGQPLARKKTDVLVLGPGRVDLHDEAANAKTLRAEWGHSLRHTKELVGPTEQDVLYFEGGGRFIDLKGEMDLAAERLVLWLAGMADSTPPPGSTNSSGSTNSVRPQKLLAVKDVKGHSKDWIIENSDQLTTHFRDVPTPVIAPKKEPVATVPPPQRPGPTPTTGSIPAPIPSSMGKSEVVLQPAPVVEPSPTKPPTHLSARVIQTWVVRYPLPIPTLVVRDGDPAAKKTSTTLKYELEKAMCEDRVVVHQDPVDKKKTPRGLDIRGIRLHLENAFTTQSGQVMTVHGTLREPAQVHYEALSLFGPIVVIDQPNNAASVEGVGRLIMPSDRQTQTGVPAIRPNELDIQWTKSMNFQGAKSIAEFVGQVQAVERPVKAIGPASPEQAPSPRVTQVLYQTPASVSPPKMDDTWDEKVVLCHRLDVTFDRPIYFNEFRREPDAKATPGKPDSGRAKLKKAVCTPMPDDEAAKLPGQVLKQVVYLDRTLTPKGTVTRAQRIDARQLDVLTEERDQNVYASGPGEVRLLQLGSKDGPGTAPAPTAATPVATPAKSPEQELKLTVVRFVSRMVAKDKGGIYREAVFDDGAMVWHFPSEDLNRVFDQHNPPPRTVVLSCLESLTVSSAKQKSGPDDQRLVARGSGEFQTDDYLGTAATISYDGTVFTLDGSAKQFAKLYPRRNPRDHTSARQILYYRDGTIRTNDSASGTITTGK